MPFAGAGAGAVATMVHPVAATAVNAMIRAMPILLITPDMTGTLLRFGADKWVAPILLGHSSSGVFTRHRRGLGRFGSRLAGFPGPAFMCPSSVWTAHRVFASFMTRK